jgi:hypothetical protein
VTVLQIAAGTTRAEIVLRRLDLRFDANADAVNASLLAWCAVNGLPVGQMREQDGITVDLEAGTVHYQRIRGDGRHGFDTTPVRRHLHTPPAGVLLGDTVCGHLLNADPPLSCRIDVDPESGRHPGDHADLIADRAWPNDCPGTVAFAGGIADATGLAPADAHALALERLAAAIARPRQLAEIVRGGVMLVTRPVSDVNGLQGRRRILERHAPHRRHVRIDDNGAVYRAGSVRAGTENAVRALCEPCGDGRHDQRGALWPCSDYTDAAAGLAAGLQEG